jgi:hypothetical protein
VHRNNIVICIQQDATLHSLLLWKLLCMFRVVVPPIIRSANNCIYSIWSLSHRYCYLPLSWKSWNCRASSGAQTTVSTASGLSHTVTAIYRCRGRVGTALLMMGGGTTRNMQSSFHESKLCNVASCWMYITVIIFTEFSRLRTLHRGGPIWRW